MSKERPVSQSEQFVVVPKTELSQRFTFITPAEVQQLTPPKPSRQEAVNPPEDLEAIGQKFEPFFKNTFKNWGVDDAGLKKFINAPELKEPQTVDYEQSKADIDPSKFGQYTLNPDTQDIDWGSIPQEKITVKKLPKKIEGKSMAEAADYIIKTFGHTHHIPGIEYWKFVLEHPDQAPNSLKDGNYHYFYGSMFRSSRGDWCVPCVSWGASASSFARGGRALGSFWSSRNRVVLVEK